MDANSTDTQLDKNFVAEHSKFWGDHDFSALLLHKIEPFKDDEDLYDGLGLSDRRIDVMLSEIRFRRKNNS